MRKLSLIMAVLVLAVAAFGASTASASNTGSFTSGHHTVVYNHGNNPGDNCSNTLYSYDGVNLTLVGVYVGQMHLVLNPEGMQLVCLLHLVSGSGPGVSSTLVLRFDGLHQVYTSSGNATFSLHA